MIRKARLADVPKIVDFAISLMQHHSESDRYFELDGKARETYTKYFKTCVRSGKKRLLVALVDDVVVGYVLGEISNRSPVYKFTKIGVLHDMYILPEHRGGGLAKEMLEALKQFFKDNGAVSIELIVHTNNEVGKAAWKKLGFEEFMSKQRLLL